jgi:chlorophyll synthase
MAAPQVIVVAFLLSHSRRVEALLVTLLLVAQGAMMPILVREPRKRAPLYNATGTTFYVLGMLVSAFAMRALLAAGK